VWKWSDDGVNQPSAELSRGCLRGRRHREERLRGALPPIPAVRVDRMRAGEFHRRAQAGRRPYMPISILLWAIFCTATKYAALR
jgi:hypothetical protein